MPFYTSKFKLQPNTTITTEKFIKQREVYSIISYKHYYSNPSLIKPLLPKANPLSGPSLIRSLLPKASPLSGQIPDALR
jgi:hypothetical protein